MRKKVELVWRKETESGAEGLGLQRGVESRGAETPVASPTPEAGLKDWCRGGRGAERAAAVAAARLPAPEHAREPPRSPLLPRPRRPAPRRQVSPALGKEAGGRGEKQKENRVSVWPKRAAWWGSDCHFPGTRRPHPGSPPRARFPQRSFSPACAQIAGTRRHSPAWPAGGGLGAASRGLGGRSRGRLLLDTSLHGPLLTQTFGVPEAGLRPYRAPTSWKCSAEEEAKPFSKLAH